MLFSLKNSNQEIDMKLTKEKISYLLHLYDYQNDDFPLTKMARHMGVSKSTLSRQLQSFYEEGMIEEKGKVRLTAHGCQMARIYKQNIEKIRSWLIENASFTKAEAYQEALSLFIALSLQGQEKLTAHLNMSILFDKLDHVKSVHGDMLALWLEEGNYPFSFTIYQSQHLAISMANEGFVHPGVLKIEKGRGTLCFVPKEIEHRSIPENLVLTGVLDTFEYDFHDQFHKAESINGEFMIPISDFQFHFCNEERILQTVFKIRVHVNVGLVDVPVHEAIMAIIFK